MTMIDIKIDTAQLQAALTELQQKLGHLRPALKEIGDDLVESTQQRFETGIGPDGIPWEPNKPSTIAKFTHRVGGTMTKDRKLLTKAGERRWDSKKPLTDSGTLGDDIDYTIIGDDTLIVYSTREYAAMQQFGGTKAEFPHLWGDIPPRPFLGLSIEDEVMIRQTLSRWLKP